MVNDVACVVDTYQVVKAVVFVVVAVVDVVEAVVDVVEAVVDVVNVVKTIVDSVSVVVVVDFTFVCGIQQTLAILLTCRIGRQVYANG